MVVVAAFKGGKEEIELTTKLTSSSLSSRPVLPANSDSTDVEVSLFKHEVRATAMCSLRSMKPDAMTAAWWSGASSLPHTAAISVVVVCVVLLLWG